MPKRKRKSSTNGKRNWSELPEDILHLFSKKLPGISDFIRFRAVCKTWQSSAPVTDPPPQLPWLLERRHQEHRENGIMRFYCILTGKVHTITCPGSCGASLQGPTCRYLLACHMRSPKMYLLNPLTHNQICVPFVNFLGIPDYICSNPIEGRHIVVISRYGNMQHNTPPRFVTFWRPEADDWINLQGITIYPSGNEFYMGQYFSNDFITGITKVIDIATKKLAYQVAPPEGRKGCTVLVESEGKILRLLQYYEDGQCCFDIYNLYFGDDEGKTCWVKINDIGDQMLFVQYHRGLSFRARNFDGFKGNCIYFLKDKQHLCRYNIGEGTTEVMCCPFDLVETWFVPSLI